MTYGYARVSTDARGVAPHIAQLPAAGCEKVSADWQVERSPTCCIFALLIVGLDYGYAAQNTLDDIVGGSSYFKHVSRYCPLRSRNVKISPAREQLGDGKILVPIFSYVEVGTGDSHHYIVRNAGRKPIGRVRKDRQNGGWIAEEGQNQASGFLKREDAARWLAGCRAIEGPLTDRILAFDPTPAGLIVQPLRAASKSLWQRIRNAHFAQTPPICEICKSDHEADQIHGHEVYSFFSKFVRLERVAFVCYRCHDAIHLERTQGRTQAPYVREIVNHYCRVNGGLTQEEFKKDLAAAQQRMFGIRDFYRGSSPPLNYGPFQEEVERVQKRREERPVQKPLMQRLREFGQAAETKPGHTNLLVEALAQALAYNDVQAELPDLRLIAEGVISDLSQQGVSIGQNRLGKPASLREASAISQDATLTEALAKALLKNKAGGQLPYLRVIAEGVIRDLSMHGIAVRGNHGDG